MGKWSRRSMVAVLAGCVWLQTGTAHAQSYFSGSPGYMYYPGVSCQVDYSDNRSELTSSFPDVLVGGDHAVICPVIKTTSAPGVTNDGLADVHLDVNLPNGAGLACNLNVYDASITTEAAGNAVGSYPGVLNAQRTTISFPSAVNAKKGWWRQSGFWFAQVECTPSGATPQAPIDIVQYFVTENGPKQPAFIYPPSACHGTGGDWYYRHDSLGFLNMADRNPSTGPTFIWSCNNDVSNGGTGSPIDTGLMVDLAYGPNQNYSMDFRNFLGQTVTVANAADQYPTKFVWNQRFNSTNYAFELRSIKGGDGKFLGYRSYNLMIDCGNTSAPVAPFFADFDYSGGGNNSHTEAIDLSGVSNPAPMDVYKTGRINPATYTVPLFQAGSSHKVRLHFAETYWSAAGKRKFNVTINGTAVLSNFDIFVAAGNKMRKAVVKEFTVNANANGQIIIATTKVTDNPLIAGIEIQ
jgi:hypothetical protein